MIPALETIDGQCGSVRLTLPPHLCGPPDCANGGVVAGLLARHLTGPVEVTLRRPVPLDEPVTLERLGSAALLRLGHEVLALAQPGDAPPDPPRSPGWAEVLEASGLRAAPEAHPFPTCFVCGPARDCTDALCLQPGPFPDLRGVATPWIPTSGTGDEEGNVRPEFLWAALDCPGGFAALVGGRPRPIVLGRITAHVGVRPRVGDPLIVQGWKVAAEGRKHIVGTAIHDLDGRCMAVARATWLAI